MRLPTDRDADGLLVPTGGGPARVDVVTPTGARVGTLVVTHGAGGGTSAPDLRVLAATARSGGYTVVAVEQPYRVAGRRAPTSSPQQDAAWCDIVVALDDPGPLVFGGRSNGARVACRTADPCDAVGVVALAFPVHPPGRPDRNRLAELAAPTCPVLVVQGERDPFGVPGRRKGRRVAVIPGSDHRLHGSDAVIEREAQRFLAGPARSRCARGGTIP